MSNIEEWQDCLGYEGIYQVSSLGKVKSVARIVNGGRGDLRKIPERILKASGSASNGKQYPVVSFYANSTKSTIRIHQLVLEAFVGPRPDGFDGCHNNGDTFDNRLSNLRWDTHQSNANDTIEHGTDNRGERNGTAKLTNYDILDIRANILNRSRRELAKEYSISYSHICSIIRGERWGHVK